MTTSSTQMSHLVTSKKSSSSSLKPSPKDSLKIRQKKHLRNIALRQSNNKKNPRKERSFGSTLSSTPMLKTM